MPVVLTVVSGGVCDGEPIRVVLLGEEKEEVEVEEEEEEKEKEESWEKFVDGVHDAWTPSANGVDSMLEGNSGTAGNNGLAGFCCRW